MKWFLCIAVINMSTVWIYDTYNDYIIRAADIEEARTFANMIFHLVEVDEVKEIAEHEAKALMKINRTKVITDNVTQIILF